MVRGVFKRKPHSEETKRKIGNANRGHKHTDSFKENLSKIKKGKPSHKKGSKLSDEVKEKISKSKIGKYRGVDSPHWKIDRDSLKKNDKKHLDTQYRYWMLGVKKRDSWKCKLLNSDCKGRLESHHIFNWIDYPELRYNINNGITLCHFHHPRGREEEKRMIPILQELLSVSKE